MNLGERIFQLRTQLELSQNGLAEMLHVSRQSVSKWENNNAVPDLEKAVKLSEIFGVSLDELVKGNDSSIGSGQNGSDKDICGEISGETRGWVSKDAAGRPLRKIAGVILLCMSLFVAMLMLFGTGSILSVLLVMSPFLLCGLACLKAEQHLGLWCSWAIFSSVDMYLRCGTVCDWTQVFYDMASVGLARGFIVRMQLLGMIVMILWTGISLRKVSSSRREELGRACGLSWGIFVLALLFVEMGNKIVNQLWDKTLGLYNYLLGRYCFGLLDWVRIAAFTLAVVSTVRYLYARRSVKKCC